MLRRTRFLTGQYDEELGIKDVTWINANGEEMQEANWKDAGDEMLRHAAGWPGAKDRHQAAW